MGVLEDVEACVRSEDAAEALDPRALFWRLRAAPAGLRLETTDAAFAARRRQAVQARFPALRLDVVLLPVPTWQGQCAWVTASVADVRRQPAHQAEQTTQALQGESLAPLLHEDGWLLARLPDGYWGWVRDWHVRFVAEDTVRAFGARADARIGVPLARIRTAPAPTASVCAESPMGTPVVRRRVASDCVELELPGGRTGWVQAQEVHAGGAHWPALPAAILATLHEFLGVPYVWGGKSPKGFDCSGLVQFVFGLHGVALPRDADQQAACGTPVQEFAAGDLLFFGRDKVTHVGVALDEWHFVHARGDVRKNSLSPGSSLHAADLVAILRGGRRLLPRTA